MIYAAKLSLIEIKETLINRVSGDFLFSYTNMIPSFHFAYHVTDLDKARAFYAGLLGAREGRSTDTWVDFDFYGHQLSLHLGKPFPITHTGKVGDHLVPMPHYGVVLEFSQWRALADRLIAHGVDFILRPSVRFEGEPGEQWTFFILDPSGNAIEIKGLARPTGLFET
jgi:uncharacterized protein